MMIKRAYLGGQESQWTPLVLPSGDRAVKTASAGVQSYLDSLEVGPGHLLALCNAMGYSEYYGPNSNKDWYGLNSNLDFNGLLHAPANWSPTDEVRGKAWPYGFPTFFNGHVFAHHRNNNPKEHGFGKIVWVAPNDQMKRIDLVIDIDVQEARDKGKQTLVDRILNGERVDTSIGCRVPFDTCTICTDWKTYKIALKTFDPLRHPHEGIAVLEYHRRVKPIRGLSVTTADRCECMKSQGGKILGDGRLVCVFNDYCKFFDQSLVWVGADRTAKVMYYRHASDNEGTRMKTSELKVVDVSWVNTEKTAGALNKVSKNKAGEIRKLVQGALMRVHPDIRTQALRELKKKHSSHEVLSGLAALGVVLKPLEFMTTVAEDFGKYAATIDNCVDSRVGFNPNMAVVPSYTYAVGKDHLLSPMLSKIAGDSEFMARSCFSLPPTDATEAPVLLTPDTPLMAKLASEYLGYRISVLEAAKDLYPHYYVHHVHGGIQKTAGIKDLLPLLLGLGPVIHLISAHLKSSDKKDDSGTTSDEHQPPTKELGVVAQFVKDNPTFTAMTAIGAGLKAVLGAGEKGTMLRAIKEIAKVLV